MSGASSSGCYAMGAGSFPSGLALAGSGVVAALCSKSGAAASSGCSVVVSLAGSGSAGCPASESIRKVWTRVRHFQPQ